jgi:hypothetical protein
MTLPPFVFDAETNADRQGVVAPPVTEESTPISLLFAAS